VSSSKARLRQDVAHVVLASLVVASLTSAAILQVIITEMNVVKFYFISGGWSEESNKFVTELTSVLTMLGASYPAQPALLIR
jgi:hypothetical protein